MTRDRILIVDSDAQLTATLTRYLEKQSFKVISVASAEQMDTVLTCMDVDLCILEVNLPDRDGFEIIRTVRASSNLPIIVLSERDDAYDRVIGLELGADDYMSKPFETRELLARIKTILRRCKVEALALRQLEEEAPLLQFGDWIMNLQDRTLRSAKTGKKLSLTTSEFELLQVLTRRPNTVLNRAQLLDDIRGREAYPGDRTIDVHIMRLRKKIEPDPAMPIYIKTIHGIGYCFIANVTRPSNNGHHHARTEIKTKHEPVAISF
ncbi:response regulator [Rhodobacteraceae bacterium RKSG542]|uniref:winged helix-turn-helix domain-containing protein n=1 Tax=Pseudovibrio flavus TaxID=2529854 RepID=UPI0012BB66FD|nr:winged helix-turn-helix domain-containing protein [Pseudovibrio flavus]MTI16011.1 response regulator [Pseudovibrio flavus]